LLSSKSSLLGPKEPFSAHLAASMRGVSPEVDSWGSLAIRRRLCWRPVCIGIHLGGVHLRRAVCLSVWHMAENPYNTATFSRRRRHERASLAVGRIAKLDAETHPDPRPASPEKEAGPKSIGTSAEKTFLLCPLSSELTLCTTHCRLFWHGIRVSILFRIFHAPGTCYGVSSASEASIFGRQPKQLTNAHLFRREGLLTGVFPILYSVVLCGFSLLFAAVGGHGQLRAVAGKMMV
jgi:hypothetical protein